VSINTITQKF